MQAPATSAPALVWYHGGGMIMGSLHSFAPPIRAHPRALNPAGAHRRTLTAARAHRQALTARQSSSPKAQPLPATAGAGAGSGFCNDGTASAAIPRTSAFVMSK